MKNQEERERSVYGLDAIDGPLASPQMPPISGEFYQQRGYVRQRLLENREKFADETFVNDEETDETEEAVSEEPTA